MDFSLCEWRRFDVKPLVGGNLRCSSSSPRVCRRFWGRKGPGRDIELAFSRSVWNINGIMFRFILPAFLAFLTFFPAHAENLLGRDTGDFPGGFELRVQNGRQSTTGRLPAPWAAVYTEERGNAVLRFGPDPVRERPAFGLVNLSPHRGLALVTDPPVTLIPGTEYVLEFEHLTTGGGLGAARLSGAVRRTVPLRDSQQTWQRTRERFTADSDSLRLEFTSASTGPEQAVYISRLRLRPADAPEQDNGPSAPHAGRTGAALRGAYGLYQQAYRDWGGLSFLNTPDADNLVRGVEGGRIRETENMPFSVFRRYEVERPGATPAAVRLQVSNTDSVLEGETLVMVFYARGEKFPQEEDDGLGAEIQVLMRGPDDVPGSPPFAWMWTERNLTLPLRERWTRHVVPAVREAHRDIPPGEMTFEIHMAMKAQQVDIGGLALVSVSNARRDRFPSIAPTYVGRGPGAAWRREAEDRIRAHRTGELVVRVTDGDDNPVPGARVELRMRRHSFGFGTRVSLPVWHGRGEFGRGNVSEDDRNMYRNRSMAYFNRVNLKNAFSWRVWDQAGDSESFRELLGETLGYYQDRNVSVTSGPLLVPGRQHLPDPPPDDVSAALARSIRERTETADDRVADWIVVRGTAGNRDLLRREGSGLMTTAFNAAGETAPNARLWLEEADIRHAILSGAFQDFDIPAEQGWPGWLRGQNAPLHGLAAQAQGGILLDIGARQWWRIFDAVQERFDLPVRFTRLHTHIRNPEDPEQVSYQTDMFRDTLTTLFAHPAVDGIELEGFWAPAHPFASSALWDADWQPTPVGQVYLDLVFEQWWTETEGTTDASGALTLRGYHGHYELTVEHNGESRRKLLRLKGGRTEAGIQL